MSVLTTTAIKVAPSAADSPTITSGAGVMLSGAWTQMLASTSAAAVFVGVHIWPAGNNGGEIDIGVGGAGSETVLSTVRYMAPDISSDHETAYLLLCPVSGIPNGGRISARHRCSVPSTGAALAVMYAENFDSDHVTDKPLSSVPSNSAITITPSGTAWANSSWVEFTSGLSDPAALASIPIFPDTLTGDFEIDLGTGGAGSETVIDTIKSGQNGISSGQFRDVRLKALREVAASTRIAVRMRKSGTSTNLWVAALQYYANLTAFNPKQKVTQTFLEILDQSDADDEPPTKDHDHEDSRLRTSVERVVRTDRKRNVGTIQSEAGRVCGGTRAPVFLTADDRPRISTVGREAAREC